MVSIPEGELDTSGQTVSVAAFCLDRQEVTVAAYAACVRDGHCSPECLQKKTCSAVPTQTAWRDAAEAKRASAFCNGHRADRLNHPVNCVSFDEAKQFCSSKGRRLPTSHEWIWAARGARSLFSYPWGASAPSRDELCWGGHRPRNSTCPADQSFADRTRQGVLHLAGNLSEWTATSEVDPQQQGKLFGSSWWSVDDGYVRASLDGVPATAARSEVYGFRCARAMPR